MTVSVKPMTYMSKAYITNTNTDGMWHIITG